MDVSGNQPNFANDDFPPAADNNKYNILPNKNTPSEDKLLIDLFRDLSHSDLPDSTLTDKTKIITSVILNRNQQHLVNKCLEAIQNNDLLRNHFFEHVNNAGNTELRQKMAEAIDPRHLIADAPTFHKYLYMLSKDNEAKFRALVNFGVHHNLFQGHKTSLVNDLIAPLIRRENHTCLACLKEMQAISYKDKELCKYFIDAIDDLISNKNPEQSNKYVLSSYLSFFRLYLENEGDISLQTTHHQNLLHLVIRCIQSTSKKNDSIREAATQLLKVLLLNQHLQAIINQGDLEGKTPLDLADFKQTFLLLAAGATPILKAQDNINKVSLINIFSELRDPGHCMPNEFDRQELYIPPSPSSNPSAFHRLISQIDIKNIAHFFGDVIIKKAKNPKLAPEGMLEGNTDQKSLQFLLSLFELIAQEDNQLSADEKKQLGQAIEALRFPLGIVRLMTLFNDVESTEKAVPVIQELIEFIHHTLDQLPIGQSLILPAGWTGLPSGHAMLCELKKSAEGTLQLHIYNSGAGAQYHDVRVEGHKFKVTPYQCFQPITLEEIKSSYFLEALLEPVMAPAKSSDNQYSEEDIYQAILSRFAGKRVNSTQENRQLKITLQRSGTCSMQTPLAFLHHFFGTELHKKALLEGRLRVMEICSFIETYQYVAQISGTGNPKEWRAKEWNELMQFAIDNLSRTILKRDLITPELTPKYYARLKQITETRQFELSTPATATPFTLPATCETFKKKLWSLTLPIKRPPSTILNTTSFSPTQALPKAMTFADVQTAVKSLQLLKNFCLSVSKTDAARMDHFLTDFLTNTVLNIPLPKPGGVGKMESPHDIWSQMYLVDTMTAFSLIFTLLQILLGQVVSHRNVELRQTLALYKLCALLWHLGCQQERIASPSTTHEKCLSYYGVDISPLKKLREAKYLLPFSPQEDLHLSELIAFFEQNHPKPGSSDRTLFNFGLRDEFEIPKAYREVSCGEYQYLNALIKDLPKEYLDQRKYDYEYNNQKIKPPFEIWMLAVLWNDYPHEGDKPIYYAIRDAFLSCWLAPSSKKYPIHTNSALPRFTISHPTLIYNQSAYKTLIWLEPENYDANPANVPPPLRCRGKDNELFDTDISKMQSDAFELPPEYEHLIESEEKPIQQNKSITDKNKLRPLYEIALRKNLRPHMLIEYFSQHLDKLHEKEIQDFVLVNLFSQGVLAPEIQENPELVPSLVKFLEKGMDEFRLQLAAKTASAGDVHSDEKANDLISSYLFLLSLIFQILDYTKALAVDVGELDKTLREKYREQLQQWVQQPPPFAWLEPKAVQAQIRLVLLNSYSTDSWKNPDGVQQLCCHSAKLGYYRNAISTYEKSILSFPLEFQEARRRCVFAAHADELSAVFSQQGLRQRICSSALKEYGLQTSEDTPWTGNYPVFAIQIADDLYELDMHQGKLFKNKIQIKHESDLFDLDDYRKVLGKHKLENITKTEGPDKHPIYIGHHPVSKEKYRIEVIESRGAKDIKIFKYWQSEEYQYVPWENTGLLNIVHFSKAPNQDAYLCWMHLKQGNLRIEDKATGSEIMKILPTGLIRLPSESAVFELLDVSQSAEWMKLCSLDTPIENQFLKKTAGENGIVSDPDHIIIYNRIKNSAGEPLVFKREVREKRKKSTPDIPSQEMLPQFYWKENPHYFIDTQAQAASDFTQNPPLILRDKKGHRKGIFPIKFIADYRGVEQKEFKGETFTFELIALSKEGQWMPSNTKQHLLLAYKYLGERKYIQALHFLKKTGMLQPFKSEELQLLGWIFMQHEETKDFRPEAKAIRLYAAWMVHKNQRLYPTRPVAGQVDARNTYDYVDYYSPSFWLQFWKNEAAWKIDKGFTTNKENSSCLSLVAEAYHDYCEVAAHLPVSMRLDNPGLKQPQAAEENLKLLKPLDELDWLLTLHKNIPNLFFESSFIAARIKQLLGAPSHEIFSLPPQRYEIEASTARMDIYSLKDGLKLKLTDINLDEILATFPRLRPGENFEIFYGPLFKIAYDGIEADKQKLLTFLNDMQFEKIPEHQAFRAILHAFCFPYYAMNSKLRASAGALKSIVQDLIFKKRDTYIHPEILPNTISEYLKALHTTNGASLEHIFGIPEASIPDRLIPNIPSSIRIKMPLSLNKEEERVDFNAHTLQKYFHKPSDPIPHEKLWELSPKLQGDAYAVQRHAQLQDEYRAGCAENDAQRFYTVLPNAPLNELEASIKEKISNTHILVKELKAQIDAMTRQLPEENDAKLRAHLKLLGHKILPTSFEKLAMLFAQEDAELYALHLPFLTKEQISELHTLVGNYFMQSTNLQLYEKSLAYLSKALKLQAANKSAFKIQEAYHQCAECLNAHREYNPSTWPAFLLFEYFSGFNLRKEQVLDLQDLVRLDTGLEQGYASKILQRIMSAGKTVVYGTLLAFLKADGYHLSILLPPSSLFETNAQDMLQRSESYFGQKGIAIDFKRDSEYLSFNHLQYLYGLLVSAIHDRNYVMMSMETLQSMQNAYIESLDKLSRRQKDLAEHQSRWHADKIQAEKSHIAALAQCHHKLKQILALIQERGAATFDEVDMACNPRKELNSPTEEIEHLDPTAVRLVTELFKKAADPKIIALGLNLQKNEQARMLPEQYEAIKTTLAKEMVEYMAASNELKSRLALPADLDKQQLIDYFTLRSHPIPEWIRECGNSSVKHRQDTADYMILMRQQLLDWLPEAWKRTADEHYGRSKENPRMQMAKPNLAANTPNEKAEISDRWETVNKTCQLYITKGLDLDQTKQLILNLCNKAMDEWKESASQIPLEDTQACKLFAETFKGKDGTPLDLFNVNVESKDTLAILQKQLKNGTPKSIQLILDYLREEAFPAHGIFVEQISNNPQSGAAGVKSFQGYSGTLENPYIFHPSLSGKIARDLRSNGRVIDVLLSKSHTAHKISSDKLTASQLLHEILDPKTVQDRNQFHALIDLGVLFKGYSNKDIALSILDYFHEKKSETPIQGVLYYDSDSNELNFIKKGSSEAVALPGTDPETIAAVTGLKPEELFTFYDHRHTTGANILQTNEAKAIVTFNESATLRDVLQAVMRMRKLLHNQKVEFTYTESLLAYINQTLGTNDQHLSLDKLLLFASMNGFRQEQEDNIRVTYQKMYDLASSFIRHAMYAQSNIEKEISLYETCKAFFVKSQRERLYEMYASIPSYIPKKQVLEDLKTQILSDLKKIDSSLNLDLKTLEQDFDNIIREADPLLPQNLPSSRPKVELGSTVEHEQRQETNKQKQTQQQQEQEQDRQRIDQSLTPNNRDNPADELTWPTLLKADYFTRSAYPSKQTSSLPAIWSLSDYLAEQPAFKNYAHLFPAEIQVTENFLTTRLTQHDFFSDTAKKPHQMLLIEDAETKKFRVIFLSLHEASQIKTSIRKNQASNDIRLLSAEGEIIAGPKLLQPEQNESYMHLLTYAQLCSGNWQSLSQIKWEAPLQTILADKKRALRNLFEIALIDPSERVQYRNSRLAAIFEDITTEEPSQASSLELDQWNSFVLAVQLNRISEAISIFKKLPRSFFDDHPDHSKLLWNLLSSKLFSTATQNSEELQDVMANLLNVMQASHLFINENEQRQLMGLLDCARTPKFVEFLGDLLIPLTVQNQELEKQLAYYCQKSILPPQSNNREILYSKHLVLFQLMQTSPTFYFHYQDNVFRDAWSIDLEKTWEKCTSLTITLKDRGVSFLLLLARELCSRYNIVPQIHEKTLIEEIQQKMKRLHELLFSERIKALSQNAEIPDGGRTLLQYLEQYYKEYINEAYTYAQKKDTPLAERQTIMKLLQESQTPYAEKMGSLLKDQFPS